jgi:diaminohydroxyphosphoribosylaminopyrimidine deaminase/5-amino-6-(5-phosphoribosylamino)uracil reductase
MAKHYMQHALALAKQGEFSARPNPCVGCVIVKDNEIVGEGFHWQTGQNHAEINALEQAKEKAFGATCYVTLEPCAHVGRTGPCVDKLIASGVAKVVIATSDPNPLTAGKGIKALIEAGINVEVGLLEKEAFQLNIGFFSRMERGKPYVRAKVGMSLDGRIAMANGESQWITCSEARKAVQWWRAKSGAVITGTGTVKRDNCRLTVRESNLEVKAIKPALRVIVDSSLSTAEDAAIFQEAGSVVVATTANMEKQERFMANVSGAISQVECITLPSDATHRVDIAELLAWLGEKEINDVLVEAGPTLVGAMLKAKLIDELLLFVAPTLLGSDAQPLAYIPGLQQLSDHIPGEFTAFEKVGDDLFINMKLSDFGRD